ncbi:DUF6221 family protein [Nocardia abscessus]|uniref:DUF6221 family protein n=1 Tax=Nocardia abscessus TaxID=120957 RepID=UPI002458A341|nr:DUF6221 family protein [Nocardia abscessus]
MTIVEFITARLEEHEQIAQAAIESAREDTDGDTGEWFDGHIDKVSGGYVTCGAPGWPSDQGTDWGNVVFDEGYPHVEQARHIAVNDPNSALRFCRLVRAMLGHAEKVKEDELEQASVLGYIGRVVQPYTFQLMHRDIAAYWNTHPDYQPEWTTTPADA